MDPATAARRIFAGLFLLLLVGLPRPARAQAHEDFDKYKLRIYTLWFYSSPTGSFQGPTGEEPIDIQTDLGFNSHSTFNAKVDWKFTRKNHLYVTIAPNDMTRTTTLTRTIVFEGKTFTAQLVVHSELNTFVVAPGYQYDIIRRKRGHLGIGVQMDLADTSARLHADAQIVGGEPQAEQTATGSLLAPIPVAGPQFRFYLTNSPKVYVDGNVYGMYLFGYGNLVSTSDWLGIKLANHLSLDLGYQLGSRLVINNAVDRPGFRLTQKGAIAGLDFSF
jgi:hypothetical protein